MSLTLPRWVAHRGGGLLAPENTLAGIRLAARLGVPAVEFDVMLSAEGTPFLIHDETLERTTNGVGAVADALDDYLRTLDAGAGEPLPLFVEAARLCREQDLFVNVEIKPSRGRDVETGRVVAQQVAAFWHDQPERVLISSFSEAALAEAMAHAPAIRRGLLCEAAPSDWLSRMRRLACFSLHLSAEYIDPAVLTMAGSLGFPVLAYTVNDPERAQALFAQGITAAFTDFPDVCRD